VYKPEVKASIIKVAGDIAVECLRQYPELAEKGDESLMRTANVVKCFGDAYERLMEFIPPDYKEYD
jgi:hypothetical protein